MLLIDADSACYAAAFTSEGNTEEQARYNLNRMMEDLLLDLNTNEYIMYLTGSNNFRYKIFPEYKANRREQPKPQHLAMLKQHLIDSWGAILSEGCEADDLVAMEHTKRENESLIITIDKDLDQLWGWHYNPRKKERYLVSPNQANRFSYYQLLVGDTADGIKGCKGIGPKKADKHLANCETEEEMFDVCRELYGCDQELQMNAQCLWLWREHGATWKWPEWAEPMEVIEGS